MDVRRSVLPLNFVPLKEEPCLVNARRKLIELLEQKVRAALLEFVPNSSRISPAKLHRTEKPRVLVRFGNCPNSNLSFRSQQSQRGVKTP